MDNPGSNNNNLDDALHRAAIIDGHGNEITITDSMINSACEALDDSSKAFIPQRGINHQ
jgi:hypothetical protein